MGSCFSISSSSVVHPPTAKVISVNGKLREYPTPISVSRVLQTEKNYEEEDHPDCFVCNSNLLYYDEYIPALKLDHQILHTDDIYFVLPTSKLQRPLTASDMAALAVKATLALQNQQNIKTKPKKGRISPDLQLLHFQSDTDNLGMSKSPSLKINNKQQQQRLRRLASSRAKLAVRSFKLRLTTIYEATAIL